MTRDARGLPITAQSDAEVASIDWFTTRLARIDRGAEAILEDAKSFPGSPMIQLGAASFCLFGQTTAAAGCGRISCGRQAAAGIRHRARTTTSRCPDAVGPQRSPWVGRRARRDHANVAARSPGGEDCGVSLLRARPAARGAALSLPHGAARGCERRGSGFPCDLCICAGVVRRRRRRAAHRRSRARDRAAQSMGPSLRGAYLFAPGRAP